MEIHKATAIEQYAKVHGRASIRYDQASVGLSYGLDRKDAYNVTWVQDCLAMMDVVAAKGNIIVNYNFVPFRKSSIISPLVRIKSLKISQKT